MPVYSIEGYGDDARNRNILKVDGVESIHAGAPEVSKASRLDLSLLLLYLR